MRCHGGNLITREQRSFSPRLVEWICLSQDSLSQLDLAALFHATLFGYQKVLRDGLGELPTATVTSLCVPVVEKILEKTSPQLLKSTGVDAALRRFGDLLTASQLAEGVNVESRGQRYVFRVDGCAFATQVHDMLRPTDVTCPYGILAAAIAHKVGGRGMKPSFSEFTATGSRTEISPQETE